MLYSQVCSICCGINIVYAHLLHMQVINWHKRGSETLRILPYSKVKKFMRVVFYPLYYEIIDICYFIDVLQQANTWIVAKNVPLFFIFKNNESPAYLQGQRDFMRLLLAAAPWSKKWTNTWLSEFAEIFRFTQYAFVILQTQSTYLTFCFVLRFFSSFVVLYA